MLTNAPPVSGMDDEDSSGAWAGVGLGFPQRLQGGGGYSVDSDRSRAAFALGGSCLHSLHGYPLAAIRMLFLLYLSSVWLYSVINAALASHDRMFIQLSNFNMILSIIFFSLGSYYAFRVGASEDSGVMDLTSGDLWIPHVAIIMFETTFCLGLVIAIYFVIAEASSEFLSHIDFVLALNCHCFGFVAIFVDYLLNKITFSPKHILYVLVFVIIGLINDAYASASYGVMPKSFAQSESTLVVYLAVLFLSALSFGLAMGGKKIIRKLEAQDMQENPAPEETISLLGDSSSPKKKSSRRRIPEDLAAKEE